MLIDTTGLTKFGNMTVISPGLENLYDGDPDTSARASGVVGWAGVSLDQPTKINRIEVQSAGDLGFDSSGVSYTIRLRLWAKTGTAPTTSTDGTCLSDITFPDFNTKRSISLVSSDQHTEWDHVWITLNTTGGYARASEIRIYDDTIPAFAPVETRFLEPFKFIGPIEVPVTTGSPFDHKVFASIFIPDIQAGDVIDPVAEFQVTSELSGNVMCSSCLVLALSPIDADISQAVVSVNDLSAGKVVKINNHIGGNFRADEEHHDPVARVGRWIADADVPNGLFLNFVIYAGKSSAQSGDIITLNSAFLWAKHERFITA